MYNYNSTIKSFNNNMNKEINNMNEIKMTNILSKLDAQGVKVGFGDQVPASLANSSKPYATGFMTGNVPANMAQQMFANGAAPGIGLIIEGHDETMSPELIELTCYLSQKPREAASLVRFCKNCLLAGNKPIRVLEDDGEKYFLCSNGKVLVRNGEEFTVYYEGTVLLNINMMSDRQILNILRAIKETYENLTEEEYDDCDDYGDEEEYEEDYDEEEEYEEEDNEWNF